MVRRMYFIAMNGTRGCLPISAEVFETREDAIEHLQYIFEIFEEEDFVKELKQNGIAYIGDEYAEIVECKCKNEKIHEDN